MGIMIDNRPTTYPGEQKVWDVFNQLLPEDIVVYNGREVLGKEYDFCLLIKNLGMIIVEVKGWHEEGIRVESPDRIFTISDTNPKPSPKKQARMYKFCMKNKLNRDLGFTPLILDMVCYPFITLNKFHEKGLNIVSEEENTILYDDLLSTEALMSKISKAYNLIKDVPHTYFTEEKMLRVRQNMEPQFVIESVDNFNLYPYSKILIHNDDMSDDLILNIVQNYENGVKYTIFTSSINNIQRLNDQLDSFQKKSNILIKGNKVIVGYKPSTKNNNFISLFNFQAYLIDNLSNISTNFEVVEGNYSIDQENVLTALSKCTSFNFLQYKIEHASTSNNILVEAGAGTGKTFSMVSRVAYLCNKQNNSLEDLSKELAMITFTNAAADNMKVRLKSMFMNYFVLTGKNRYLKFIEDIDRSNISTIDKFVIELLRKCPVYTGLGINFKVSSNKFLRNEIYNKNLAEYIEQSSDEYFKELPVNIYELRRILIDFANVLSQKSIDINELSISNLGLPQNNIIPNMNILFEEVIKKSEQEYADALAFENKMDLAVDVVMLSSILKNHLDELSKLKFKYIFIDEFQDTDDVQIELFQKIQHAIGEKCKFFVVGDLKQSIYRFRGATMSAFGLMKKNTLNEWNEYYINKNYRTNKLLLNDFDAVFTRMGSNGLLPYTQKDRLSSDIVDVLDNHSLMKIELPVKEDVIFFDGLAKIVQEQIVELNNNKEYTSKQGTNFNTIALLTRTNNEVRKIQRELGERGINVEVESTGNLYQLPSTLDLYCLLQALVYSCDNARLVNFMHSNYVRTKFDYQNLKHLNSEEIKDILYAELNNYFKERMDCSFEDILKEVYTKPILYVLKKIYDNLAPWKQYSYDEDLQKHYMTNYSYLLERIIKFSNVDNLTINQILDYLRINIITGQSYPSRETVDEDSNIKIICSTVHKSKGLEYGTVILPYTNKNLLGEAKEGIDIGMINDKLSYYIRFKQNINEYNDYYNKSVEIQENIHEEARILYVALTRAIRNCIWVEDISKHTDVSWCNMLGGE